MVADFNRRGLLAGGGVAVSAALLLPTVTKADALVLSGTGAPSEILPEALNEAEFAAARALSARFDGVSLLVEQSGTVLREGYNRPGGIDRSWDLYSGTKGLTGLYATILVQDGLLDFDQPCSDHLPQWRDDPRKRLITPRQLLSMTSGIESRDQVTIDAPERALERPCVADPGTRFIYGPAPMQCFAALVQARLRAAGAVITDPQTDLETRLLQPLGIRRERWPRGPRGAPVLAVNCHLTARQWAQVGRFILDGGRIGPRQLANPAALAGLFETSPPNRFFANGWYTAQPDTRDFVDNPLSPRSSDLAFMYSVFGPVHVALGYHSQWLILLPQRDIVIVHQANEVRAAALASRAGSPPPVFKFSELLLALIDWIPEVSAS